MNHVMPASRPWREGGELRACAATSRSGPRLPVTGAKKRERAHEPHCPSKNRHPGGPRVLWKALAGELMAGRCWSRGSGLDADRARNRRRTWWPRSARSTCCAPIRCSSSTPRKSQSRLGSPGAALATRRGPGRHDRRQCPAAQPCSGRAETTPAFAYLPETGEEILSFVPGPCPCCGPVRTLGVLVVQNRTMRQYPARRRLEALETVAMVIAENGRFGRTFATHAPRDSELDLSRPVTFKGAGRFNDRHRS